MIRTASLMLMMLTIFAAPVFAQKDANVAAGISAIKRGAYEDALRALNTALDTPEGLKQEEMAEAYFYRAMAIISAHQEALRLRKGPPVEDPYLKTCQDLAEALKIDGGRWGSDIRQLQKELFRPLIAAGIRALNGKQYERALGYMDCVVNIGASTMNDDFWPAYDMRGQARLALEDTVNALADLQMAGEVYQRAPGVTPDPLIAYVYYRTALIHRYGNQDVDQALEAVRLGKTALEAERLKMNEDRRNEVLIERFAQAQNDLDRFELDILLQNPKKYEEAVARFRESIAETPGDYTMLLAYASLLEAGDPDTAVPIYEQAIALAPDRPTAYFNLAVMYYNDGADLFQQLKARPNDRQRDDMNRRIEARFQAAFPMFERVHELDPENPDAVDALIQISKYLGLDEAVQKYTRIKQEMEDR